MLNFYFEDIIRVGGPVEISSKMLRRLVSAGYIQPVRSPKIPYRYVLTGSGKALIRRRKPPNTRIPEALAGETTTSPLK